MNKKGQLFTVIAILLILLTFVSFEFFSFLQQNKSIKTRVSTMDAFLFSAEENLERQIFISGFRVIFLADNRIISTGGYISDVNGFFNEAFFNGTVAGQAETLIMPGARYTDIIKSLNTKAAKINVNITLSNSVFLVEQNDPWNVNITLVSDFVMTDKGGLARWEKTQVISTMVSVTFFLDPVSIINRNPTKIDKILYEENTNAPSFLMRLGGDLTADVNGIELV